MIHHNLTLPRAHSAPVILIVDDDPMLLRLFALSFQSKGFQVHAFTSGQEAVALYRDHARQIDMVLLDVCMPDLDGPATLDQLQLINPDVLACFISGNTRNYTCEDLLRRGALHLFPKPCSMDDLTREVKTLLSSHLAHSA